MPNGVTIYPEGQRLIVTALGSNVFYTDTGLSSAVTLPAAVTATTTWYCSPANAGANTFTITQVDGTKLWDAVPVFVGTTADTQLRPVPTIQQLAADTGATSAGHAWTGGRENIPRAMALSNVTMTSQTMRLGYLTAPATESIGSLTAATAGTAAGATPTLCRLGLYTVASDGALALVASTANDTSLFAATNTVYTKAVSTPYTVTAGTRYAVGVLVVTAATAPVITGVGGVSTGMAALEPRLCAGAGSQADLPSSVAGATITSSWTTAIIPWVAMVPA